MDVVPLQQVRDLRPPLVGGGYLYFSRREERRFSHT